MVYRLGPFQKGFGGDYISHITTVYNILLIPITPSTVPYLLEDTEEVLDYLSLITILILKPCVYPTV